MQGVAAGRGACVLVEGEPGTGRSAVLAALVAQAEGLGLRVRSGSADGLGTSLPLRAALDCLHPDGGSVRESVTALLLGAAGRPGGAGGAAGVLAALDLMVAEVRRWCAEGPVVVALDDVHAADPASLLLWRRLAGAGTAAGLPLLLVAARRADVRRPEVDRLCRGLAERGARTLRLDPLDEDEAVAALRELLGAAPGPRLREAAALAGGNPRWLRELALHWSARGLLEVGGGTAELTLRPAELPAPPAALARSALGFLAGPAYGALRHAALLGEEFTVRELGLVRARPPRELQTDLAEPLAAGLLHDTGRAFRFRHPALRLALAADVPGALRTALLRDAAHALSEAGEAADRVAELLHRADHSPAGAAPAPLPGCADDPAAVGAPGGHDRRSGPGGGGVELVGV
ncbi:AAA family ATPase, partial [Streptomyces sp. WAC06614]|uniref:AAA family ATPase n=1 Tax=Streptomyces sp. WAC06614 TaxID=2487416 RepID=UPI000F9EC6F4